MEVYGEKPKKYTKEWWSYIWMYYKWHILGTAFVIFMVVTTLHQCATRPKYDLQVTTVTGNELYLSQVDAMKNFAKERITDATGNGEKEIHILPIHMSEQSDATTIQAGYAQFTVEVAMPEAYVFIVSENFVNTLRESEILEDTEVWAGGKEGDGCFVSLKGNEVLKSFAIDTDSEELFMGVVKLLGDSSEDPLEVKRHENGIKFARGILGLE